MARAQDPNSASCQFFICHGDAGFLDGQYAAFGRLVAGEDALDRVASVTTGGGGENSTPLEKCEIARMSVRARS
jgi:peptidyl-prolyl cis-trans isomerase B (cyclophilin B)